MILVACKITNFSLYLFIYFLNTMILRMRRHVPQWLIIGKPVNQYASYEAMFCPLHSSISIEQHKKHLGNPPSH